MLQENSVMISNLQRYNIKLCTCLGKLLNPFYLVGYNGCNYYDYTLTFMLCHVSCYTPFHHSMSLKLLQGHTQTVYYEAVYQHFKTTYVSKYFSKYLYHSNGIDIMFDQVHVYYNWTKRYYFCRDWGIMSNSNMCN